MLSLLFFSGAPWSFPLGHRFGPCAVSSGTKVPSPLWSESGVVRAPSPRSLQPVLSSCRFTYIRLGVELGFHPPKVDLPNLCYLQLILLQKY